MSFWHDIPQPIVGLSPMDGVTDPAFRFIIARHGKPDVQVTEFVNVDEVCHGGEAAWQQLQYAEIERPIVAQIYGADPDKFYQVAQVACELGFDAVVIEDWVSVLLEERPEVISIHGRTLAQMYRGRADWGAIARAAKLIRETSTLVLGNGDVGSLLDLVARVRETQVHGVLIG